MEETYNEHTSTYYRIQPSGYSQNRKTKESMEIASHTDQTAYRSTHTYTSSFSIQSHHKTKDSTLAACFEAPPPMGAVWMKIEQIDRVKGVTTNRITGVCRVSAMCLCERCANLWQKPMGIEIIQLRCSFCIILWSHAPKGFCLNHSEQVKIKNDPWAKRTAFQNQFHRVSSHFQPKPFQLIDLIHQPRKCSKTEISEQKKREPR